MNVSPFIVYSTGNVITCEATVAAAGSSGNCKMLSLMMFCMVASTEYVLVKSMRIACSGTLGNIA